MVNNPYQKITQKGVSKNAYNKAIQSGLSNNPYLKFIQSSQNDTPFQDFINKTQKNNTYNQRVKQAQNWYSRRKQAMGKGTTQPSGKDVPPTVGDDFKPGKDPEQPIDETMGDINKPVADDDFRKGNERNVAEDSELQASEGPSGKEEKKAPDDPTADIIPPTYPKPGWMFSFSYDPKHAETLEYYDVFPMILVVSSTPSDFMGVNFHYLNPNDRAKFLDALQKYTTWDDATNSLIINISYPILMAKTELSYYKPCFKMYLSSHVIGDVSPILPTEWDIAMFVPSERFKKASSEAVWADSSYIIRNS